jgi:hypothetical protein
MVGNLIRGQWTVDSEQLPEELLSRDFKRFHRFLDGRD